MKRKQSIFQPVDASDLWANSGYDEDGNSAYCDRCGTGLRWSPTEQQWYCPDCGQTLRRDEWFNYIGADPPSAICIWGCSENYPFCRKPCTRYLTSR